MSRIIKDGRIYSDNNSVVHTYTATLTSSQYGWFVFVDENGNDLLPANGLPLTACSVVNQKYYVGQFIIISGKWQFKVADINDSTNTTVGNKLTDITFTMAYITHS